MIDVADSNAVYYYHFDGPGSVVALSDSDGDSCQSYEYSVYGQVAAEDPNHTNPYMFTGRRFDIETGLYYYRARYYNPYIGRFLQTDPIGYGDGINWYAYCGNNPLNATDPFGLAQDYYYFHFTMPSELIDTKGLSMEDIPGKLMEWLTNIAISEQLPDYWELGSVDWEDDIDELLDVVFWHKRYNYNNEPYPEEVPDLAIKTVGGAKVLTVGGVGMLDDYTLKNIMAPWFAEKLAMDRWCPRIWKWYQNMVNCAITPCQTKSKRPVNSRTMEVWR